MHTKGVAVDLTLFDWGTAAKEGERMTNDPERTKEEPIPEYMGTDFDCMGEKAHWDAAVDDDAKENRKTLCKIMRGAGFETIPTEWWHWELPGNWPLLDEREVLEEPLSHPEISHL